METIRLEQDARGVARLTLARSEKKNAMSGEMIAELARAAADIAVSDIIRVVVLQAEGEVFCAGGDLNWMRAQMGADDETRRREATALAEMLLALNTLPQPLIGRVNGNAFGGGVGMMSVCDVAIAVEGTKFGLTETKLGLIPATIGPYVIARMGEAKARRVFFSSRLFGVEEAQELGLVAKIVAEEELDDVIEAEITPYLSCAPGAVAEAKALARALGPKIDRETIEMSVDALVKRWASAEAEEGTSAFFGKRKANWVE